MNILMEGTPSDLSYEEIQKAILHINGVTGIFELHIWNITSGMNALFAHVVVMDMLLTKKHTPNDKVFYLAYKDFLSNKKILFAVPD